MFRLIHEIWVDIKFIICVLIVLGFLAWICELHREVEGQKAEWEASKERIERVLR